MNGERSGRTDPLDFATLMASRLCHDVAGPCGTLLGTLELLSDTPDAEVAALSLETVRALSRKLRLLRAAWGGAAETLDTAGLVALGPDLPGAPRVKLDLQGMVADLVLVPERARLVLNAVLLAAEALRGTGTVRLSGDGRAITIALQGSRSAWPASLVDMLVDPDGAARVALAEGPRGMQGPLFALLARACGARASLLADPALSGPGTLHVAWNA